MDTGTDSAGNSEDDTASFGDTEGTDQFTGVAIKGIIHALHYSISFTNFSLF